MPTSQKTTPPVTGDSILHPFVPSASICSASASARLCPGPWCGVNKQAVVALCPRGLCPVGVGGCPEEDRCGHRCFPRRGDEQGPGEEEPGGWAVAGKEGRTGQWCRPCGVPLPSPPWPSKHVFVRAPAGHLCSQCLQSTLRPSPLLSPCGCLPSNLFPWPHESAPPASVSPPTWQTA